MPYHVSWLIVLFVLPEWPISLLAELRHEEDVVPDRFVSLTPYVFSALPTVTKPAIYGHLGLRVLFKWSRIYQPAERNRQSESLTCKDGATYFGLEVQISMKGPRNEKKGQK